MKHLRKGILMLLALTLFGGAGAWAQQETLLTTINASSGFTNGTQTFDNIVTVTLGGVSYDANDGWYCSGSPSPVEVAPVNGVTVTGYMLYFSATDPVEYEGSSFEVALEGDRVLANDIITQLGTVGITKIEVYGTAPAQAIELTKVGDNQWTLGQTPDYDLELQVEYYQKYALDSIPLDWQVKVGNAAPVYPTAYTEGNTSLGYLTISETDSVTLIPDNPLRVKSVTLTEVVSLATPLTMKALTAGTIVVQQPQIGMKYTLNGGDKTLVSGTINVAAGDKVAFYGDGTDITSYSGTVIGGTAEVKAYGNIMSLVDENGFATATTLTANDAFSNLFGNYDNLKDISGLMLPATTLTQSCYMGMFSGCTGLTTVPSDLLPATTMARGCYVHMFGGCENLTNVPTLPATTLAQLCYNNMFLGCTGLTTVPTDLLPATTLAPSCYSYMFVNCFNLTTAPTLPATTLAERCYMSMFANCENLAASPVLPATTLVEKCYSQMFSNCPNLGSVTCLATSGINQNNSTSDWLSNAGSTVQGTTTFTAATETEWPSGASGIPSGWTRLNPDGSEWVAPNPMLSIPLTLEATTAGTIVVNMEEGSLTMKYSKNGGAKTTITATTTINVAAGDKVQFYGNGTSTTEYGNSVDVSLKGTAKTKVYGNIMSLVDETGYATARTLSGSYVFFGLFMDNTKLTDASGLLLPATTLAKACYSKMFYGCNTLTAAPELPATTLAEFCYASMFSNCSALTAAPALPAATLLKNSYAQMFYGCSKLSSVTCLATSINAGNCLYQWLQGAGATVASPKLHVKTSMGSASWNNGRYFTVVADQP